VPAPDTQFVMAPSESGGEMSLFALAGRSLTIYAGARTAHVRTIGLPDDATAVDLYDLNGNGAVEVIVVAGERVLRYVIDRDIPESPQLLFSAKNQFAGAVDRPFLHVLGIEWEGRRLIGLPAADTFVLYDARGEPVAEWPIGIDAPHLAAWGQPFTLDTPHHSVTPGGNILEFEVQRRIAIVPQLPDGLPVLDKERLGMPVAARPPAPDSHSDPGYWPAFPLTAPVPAQRERAAPASLPAGLADAEVLHARVREAPHDTLIRLRTPGRGAQPRAFRTEPAKRYPGALLNTRGDRPDFNGDGLVDLALWSLPAAMPTMDRVAKALTLGRWPVRVTAHLFKPERRRFAPVPESYIEIDVPAVWFMAAPGEPPLRMVLFDDFDGDGRTDFACATEPAVFSVWLFGNHGFSAGPDWQHTFPEPLSGVEFGRAGGTIAALRGERAVYLLKPGR
jgi:hypothetical protein